MEPTKKNLRLLLFLLGLVGLLLFNSWILFFNFEKVSGQSAWVNHTFQVIAELNNSYTDTLAGESSARGYLLTKNTDHLANFTAAKKNFLDHSNHLFELTGDNSTQQERLKQLRAESENRFKLLEEMIARVSKDKNAMDVNLLNASKRSMDTVRTLIQQLEDAERGLLITRSKEAEQSREIFVWFLILTTGLTLVIIFVAFVQIKRNQDQTLADNQQKSHLAWVREHLSEAARIFTATTSLAEVTKDLQHFLSLRFGSLSSKLFVVKFNKLELISSYGTSDDASSNWNSKAGNSLLHEALKRDAPWQVENIPADYWKINSSLGQSRPTSLVFLPLRFQQKVIGLIEMATFTKMSEQHLELLTQLNETIGVGFNASQSRDHLQELLQQTQLQAEELQSQQEELKTNNEELEQQARALESQQQAMNLKNRELESIQSALESKATDLQRSSQYKSEFLAKMSHELRTPLNGLMILSTLFIENKEKNLTDQQKQFAQSIYNAGNDLLTLINDILDLSKIEARKLSLRSETFSTQACLEQLHRTFEPQVQGKKIDFKLQISKEAQNLTLFTDRQRLEQILRNFLSNAIKFTETGSITIGADTAGTDRVRFVVTDTGIGIPKNKLDMIFEAFEQADGSVSRRYGGTGLGLTISRELASLLGGEIRLTSEDGKGSEFTLIIPVHLKEQGDNVSSAPPKTTIMSYALPKNEDHLSSDIRAEVQKALQGIDLTKRSILIVEDDERFRSSVVEVVGSYGFQAIQTSQGDVAYAILNECTPDAILLDIKLPAISGLGLLEMIKQMPHLRHVPVHMISALDYQHNALRMGALGYLTKPVTMDKIRSALDRIENLISQKVRKVLLIEDDEIQSSAILNLISGSDVQIVPVRTGREAVTRLKDGVFDCIILDLTLPDVSGFDLLAELNGLEISLPPIVIYTGKDLSSEEENYLRRYSESIIIKGVRSPERLLDEVNLFLHRVESLLPQEKKEMLTQMRSSEKTFEGRTVLLADDDMRNVFALTSALESKGLKVRIAKNGIEAIESLKKFDDIDAVLMDIMMPKMDGFEAMRNIREIPEFKKLPIIALTAKAMKEDHEKCIAAGANDYLTKPVHLANLVTVLKVWLSQEEF